MMGFDDIDPAVLRDVADHSGLARSGDDVRVLAEVLLAVYLELVEQRRELADTAYRPDEPSDDDGGGSVLCW